MFFFLFTASAFEKSIIRGKDSITFKFLHWVERISNVPNTLCMELEQCTTYLIFSSSHNSLLNPLPRQQTDFKLTACSK